MDCVERDLVEPVDAAHRLVRPLEAEAAPGTPSETRRARAAGAVLQQDYGALQ